MYGFRFRICPDGELPSYQEIKEDVVKDFEEHSSVMKDLDLLEEELAQGSIYMKQSKDLRTTVEQVMNTILMKILQEEIEYTN